MIIITSDATHIYLDMSAAADAGLLQFSEGMVRKEHFLSMMKNSNHIEITADSGSDYTICVTGSPVGLPVTSVDGVEPTDINHLFQLMKAIL